VIENSIPAFSLDFENVVIDKIPFIREELMNLLTIIVKNNDESYRITESRMTSVIKKYKLEKLLEFEKSPQEELAMTLIRDTLYGQSTEDVSFRFLVDRID
jgi:hypothetical protein